MYATDEQSIGYKFKKKARMRHCINTNYLCTVFSATVKRKLSNNLMPRKINKWYELSKILFNGVNIVFRFCHKFLFVNQVNLLK